MKSIWVEKLMSVLKFSNNETSGQESHLLFETEHPVHKQLVLNLGT